MKPKKLCVACGKPVMFYERQKPPLCLSCEMKELYPDKKAK